MAGYRMNSILMTHLFQHPVPSGLPRPVIFTIRFANVTLLYSSLNARGQLISPINFVRVGVWTRKASFAPFQTETLWTDCWVSVMMTRCCKVHSTHNGLTLVNRTLGCVFWDMLSVRHNWEGTRIGKFETHSGISSYLLTYNAFGLWLSHTRVILIADDVCARWQWFQETVWRYEAVRS